ncbi:uncharacterized protein LOC122800419 [Protopterus annectens]|uniref:uncharacterized protein LOC122800419 n=1 Tax=Protopterus annectens TaxID=7888 RepID=UPI001CF9D52D|nr:uncharacterized protein LOC122800419 [Protopterus annectens]
MGYALKYSASGLVLQTKALFLLVIICVCGRIYGQMQYVVSEELLRGTVIGNLAKDLGLHLSSISSRNLRVVSKSDKQYFKVNPKDGTLFVDEEIDREQLCGRSSKCFLGLQLILDNPLEMSSVKVEILDINDNSPRFPAENVTLEIIEAVKVGSVFVLDAARDPDAGSNSLSTYWLTPNEHFTLRVTTQNDGVKVPEIVLQKELDREQQAVHYLILTAADGGDPVLTGTVNVLVKVIDINDNAPIFNQSFYNVRLKENSPIGTIVIQINATDPDEGVNGEIEYSFGRGHSSSNSYLGFIIDKRTGEVSTNDVLDFEETRQYTVQVKARDRGAPSAEEYCTLTIDLIDMNDNAPEVIINSLTTPVREDALPGTVVALIAVSDKDSGGNGQVHLQILHNVPFKLVPSFEDHYSLVTSNLLDRETTSYYNITLKAVDSGVPSLSTQRLLFIEIADVNDNSPRFLHTSYTVQVRENNHPGSYLCSVLASDSDEGKNAKLSYSIIDHSIPNVPISSYFYINSKNGSLYSARSFDYEEAHVFQIQVQVEDAGVPPLRSNVTVYIFIVDQNDNAPKIIYPSPVQGSMIQQTIPRSAHVGHLVMKVVGVDEDSGYNAWLSYRLQESQDSGLFLVSPYSGEIRTAKSFQDLEENVKTIIVEVKDSGKPSLSTSVTLVLTMEDNKAEGFSSFKDTPVLSSGSSNITLYLIIALVVISFISFLTFTALAVKCLRNGKSGTPFFAEPYCCCREQSLDYKYPYNYTAESLRIQLNSDGPLRYVEVRPSGLISQPENTRTCLPPVLDGDDFLFMKPGNASDLSNSSNAVPLTNDYSTNPSNMNSHWRRLLTLHVVSFFIFCPGCKIYGLKTYAVSEQLSRGSVVGNIADDLKLIKHSISARNLRVASKSSKQYFKVKPLDGTLVVDDEIDREQICGRSPTCFLHIQIILENPFEAHSVKVEILDINDNSPRFPTENVTLQIFEVINTVTSFEMDAAQDPDIGYNSLSTYWLSPDDYFSLTLKARHDGSKVPEIVLQKALDREQQAVHHLVLTAVDGGVPALTGTMNITIKVLDINDNVPSFNQSFYKLRLKENVPVGTIVIQLKATDPDEGVNGEIEYSFRRSHYSKSQEVFSIDAHTGEIKTSDLLDFEECKEYTIEVKARDRGLPPAEVYCTVVVEILDVNDNAPELLVNSLKTSIQEDTPPGTVVAFIGVKDNDFGDNGRVHLHLVPDIPFKLVPSFEDHFSLVTKDLLDREITPYYNMTIVAVDSGSPSLSTQMLLFIEISDVNDNPPWFSYPSYTVHIQENNIPGLPICSLIASDPDEGKYSKLVYSVADQTVQNMPALSYFYISSENGTLYSARSFDYETTQVFHLIIQAEDGGSPPLKSNVTVHIFITDQNDNAPKIIYPKAAYGALIQQTIARSAQVGYLVTKIVAVDDDSGHNAWLSYKLQQPQDADVFSISPYSGEIRVAKNLQDLTDFMQNITVEVTDKGNPKLTTSVILPILLLEEKTEGYSKRKDSPVLSSSTSNLTLYLIISLVAMSFLSFVTFVALAISCMMKRRRKHTACFATTCCCCREQSVDPPKYPYNYSTGSFRIHLNSDGPMKYVEVRPSGLVSQTGGSRAGFPSVSPGGDFMYAMPYNVSDIGVNGNNVSLTANDLVDLSSMKKVHRSLECYLFMSVFMRDHYEIPNAQNPDAEKRDQMTKTRITERPEGEMQNSNVKGFYINASGVLVQYSLEGSIFGSSMECNDLPWCFKRQVLYLFFTFCPWYVYAHMHYSIYEELNRGSVVGNVAKDLGLSKQIILGRNLRVVSKSSKQYFRVNLEDGSLVVDDEIDREELCGGNPSCFLHFQIILESPLEVHAVKVEILDINDNSPKFPSENITLEVRELVNTGTGFEMEVAQDPDVGQHSLSTYWLSPNDYFSLNIKTRHDGAIVPEIVLQRALDREQQAVHHLMLTALDGGDPALSGTVSITVKVLDMNDNAPSFNQSFYNVRVKENVPVGTVVIQVKATDPDEGVNGEIEYSFRSHGFSKTHRIFSIEPGTGEIKTNSVLDFEETKKYTIEIKARDRGFPPAETYCTVQVELIDVNDNAPEMLISSFTNSIREDAVPGTVVALISVRDDDSGDNGRVHLLMDPGIPFKLEPSFEDHFSLLTKDLLDRETTPHFNFTIKATDLGSPSLTTQLLFFVEISDVNDNPPRFLHSYYAAHIQENSSPGLSICSLMASDPDEGKNSKLVYSIADQRIQNMPVLSYFYINSENGTLHSSRSFDYETTQVFVLTVQVEDTGSPPLMSNVTVHIFIIDQNDNIPKIIYPKFVHGSVIHQTVPRSAHMGYLVTKIVGVDDDSGHNAWLSYKLQQSQGAEVFIISPYSGEIRVAESLQDLTESTYNITAEVTDNGNPGLSTSVTLVLSLEDKAEGYSNHRDIPVLSSGTSSLTMYLIISLVAISFVSFITFAVLAVQCMRKRSGDNACFTSACSCCREQSSVPNYPYNYTPGSLRIHLNSDGPLKYVEVRPREMSSHTEDSKAYFNSVSNRGDFLCMKPCNSSTLGSSTNTISLRTNDLVDLSNMSKWTSKVLKGYGMEYGGSQLFKAKQVISLCFILCLLERIYGQIHYTISEELSPNSVVGNVAKDLSLQMATISNRNLKVVSKSDKEYFKLDFKHGTLVVDNRIDREELCGQSTTCVLSLQLILENPLELHSVQVEIVDINDNAPTFPAENATLEVSEGTGVGVAFGLDAAMDLDVGSNSLSVYKLNANDYFALRIKTHYDGTKVPEMVLQKVLDREQQAVHHVMLTAIDGGDLMLSGTVNITVKVLDVNDNVPSFNQSFYSVTLRENLPVGTTVIQLRAADPDEGSNGEIEYSFKKGHSSSKLLQVFNIDQRTGIIMTHDVLDFEKAKIYTIDVKAKDRGSPPAEAYCTVQVELIDVNDNAPEVIINSWSSRIQEDALLGTVVGLFSVRDKDSGESGRVHLQMPPNIPFKFSQSFEDHYSLVTRELLDRETVAYYNFTIQAIDSGSPALSTETQFFIEVIDMNDNPPRFSHLSYTAHVKENGLPGTHVCTVSASDPDEGTNSKLSYSILEQKHERIPLLSYFYINTVNGTLYTARSLDYEETQVFQMQIQVEDAGTPPLKSNVTVHIFILDQNDNVPKIIYPKAVQGALIQQTIPRSAQVGYLVTKIVGVDEDSGYNAWLSYKLQQPQDAEMFIISPYSGEIRTVKSLQDLTEPTHKIIVEVIDNGKPALSSSVTVLLSLEHNTSEGISNRRDTPAPSSTTSNLAFYLIISLVAVSLFLFLTFIALAINCLRNKKGDTSCFTSACCSCREQSLGPEYPYNYPTGSFRIQLNSEGPVKYVEVVPRGGIPPNGNSTIRAAPVLDKEDFMYVTPLIASHPSNTLDAKSVASDYAVDSFNMIADLLSLESNVFMNEQLWYYITKISHLFYISNTSNAMEYSGSRLSKGMQMLSLCFTLCLLDIACAQIQYTISEEVSRDSVVGNVAKDLHLQLPSITGRNVRVVSKSSKQYFKLDSKDGTLVVDDKIDREELCGQIATCVLPLQLILENPLEIHSVQVEIMDVNDNSPAFPAENVTLKIPEGVNVGTYFGLDFAIDADVGSNSLSTYRLSTNDYFILRVKSRYDGAKVPEIVLQKALDREQQAMHNLVLTAIDGGQPVLSGTVNITIKVLDINDNSPRFNQSFYRVAIPENSPIGTVVIHLKATDPDEGANGEVEYSFKRSHASSKVNQAFGIDHLTGEIKTNEVLDFEESKSYTIEVRATDRGLHPAEDYCTVQVDLIDVNDNSPEVIINSWSNRIQEDALPGTVVGLISVRDRDFGENGRVYLQIPPDIPFKLLQSFEDHYSLVTKELLDREILPYYNITLIAVDSGSPSLSTKRQLFIEIADVNDNPPRFPHFFYTAHIMENSPAGTFVCSMMASDPDEGKNAKLSYSIWEQKAENIPLFSYFYINPENGTMYTARTFDYEETQSFQVQIQVEDAGKPPLRNNVTVYIFILDQNDNAPKIIYPKAIQGSVIQQSVPRSAHLGYLVTKIVGVDEDSGYNAWLSYRLQQPQDTEVFIISLYSGEIRTAKNLQDLNELTHKVLVEVSDKGNPALSSSVTILLNLEDSTTEGVSNPMDNRVPSSGISDVTFYLIISLAAVSLFWLLIFIVLAINCLRNRKHGTSSFTAACCTCWEQNLAPGYPYNYPTGSFRIQLNSDGPLKYVEVVPSRLISPAENSRPGVTPLLDGEDFVHMIPLLGPDPRTRIVATSLSTNCPMDPCNTEHAMEYFGALHFTRQVLNLLFFFCFWHRSYAQMHYAVPEELSRGSVVGNVAKDLGLDRQPISSRNLRVVPESGKQFFKVNSEDGTLVIKDQIDREQVCDRSATCSLQLQLIMENPWELQTVKVEIVDINDNSPRFPTEEVTLEIREVAGVGTSFGLDMAEDPDVGSNSISSYSLSPNDHFVLRVKNRDDGAKVPEIVLQKVLDRELQETHHLMLTAVDGGEPVLSGTVHITVKVLDINDNAPSFGQSFYNVKLEENLPVGSLVIQLNATDPDEGVNGEIEYSFRRSHTFSKSSQVFNIDKRTGEIRTNNVLDFEDSKHYTIEIKARDRGSPPAEQQCTVNVELMDVNDNAPEVTVNFLTSPIQEDAPIGTVIALIGVKDKDSGENGRVHLQIGPNTPFKLTQSLEEHYSLVTKELLDREAFPYYNVTVTASDSGSPSLSTQRTLFIEISDVNDNPPHFSHLSYTAKIHENTFPGFPICSVTAVDPDQGKNSKLSYSIRDQTFQNMPVLSYFYISSENGTLYSARSFDYEQNQVFQLEIQVEDAGVPPLRSNVTIHIFVIDQNDNAPKIIYPKTAHGVIQQTISRSVPIGYLVTKIVGIDEDSGYNAWLSYRFQQPEEVEMFVVSQYTGEIRTSRSMQDVPETMQKILVEVTDHGKPALSTTVTLKLSLEDKTSEGFSTLKDTPVLSSGASNLTLYLVIALVAISFVSFVTFIALAINCLRNRKKTVSSSAAFCCCCRKQTLDSKYPYNYSEGSLRIHLNSDGPLKYVEVRPSGMISQTPQPSRARFTPVSDEGDFLYLKPCSTLPLSTSSATASLKTNRSLDLSKGQTQPNTDWRFSQAPRPGTSGTGGSQHLEEVVGPWPTNQMESERIQAMMAAANEITDATSTLGAGTLGLSARYGPQFTLQHVPDYRQNVYIPGSTATLNNSSGKKDGKGATSSGGHKRKSGKKDKK